MESKEKILVPKLDNMLKHVGHHKATILGPCRVKVGFFVFKNNYQHACNEGIYTTFKCHSIIDLIDSKIPHDKRQKFVLFFSIYHLMFQGRAMTSFEGLKDLFIVLKVKHILKNIGVAL